MGDKRSRAAYRLTVGRSTPQTTVNLKGAHVGIASGSDSKADHLSGLRDSHPKLGGDYAMQSVISAENDETLRAKKTARSAVLADALHEVVLLSNSRHSVAPYALPNYPTEELVDPRLPRQARREDRGDIVRISLEKDIRGQIAGSMEPAHSLPPRLIQPDLGITIGARAQVIRGCSHHS